MNMNGEHLFHSRKKNVKRSIDFDSAGWLLLILSCSIFVSEMLVMLFLDTLPPLSRWAEALIDSLLLSIPVFAILYFFVLRPLTNQITVRKRAEDALRRREVILEAVSFAAEQFLKFPDWAGSIESVLARLGQAAEVSRVYIFENHTAPDGTLLASQRFEWVAPGVTSEIDNPDLQNCRLLERGFGRWVEKLGGNEVIHGYVREFPQHEQQILGPQGILSIAVVPIFAGEKWWGFIGYDETHTEREWHPAEIEALRNAASTLGAAVRRERMDGALRESEQRFQELVDSIMEGLGLVDVDETIVYCNPAFAAIFEEDSAARMIGKSLMEYLPEEQQELVRAQTGIRRRGMSSQYELDIITGKSNRKTILASVSPRFDKDRQFLGAFGVVMDLTEQKKLEELAARAEKLEAAGRIAGQVAHDFNNLLGPLMAYPELIRSGLPEDHPVLKFLHAMEKAAEQMAQINQQLLTLGRRGHYNQEPLNLNDIMPLVVDQIVPIPETLAVEQNLCPTLMNIKGGGSQIFRAIVNLVTNARDAMQDDGTLTIRTENYYVVQSIGQLNRIPQGEYVKLTIADTGPGIPTDIMPKIFDPFFTTKPADRKRGSGLGLSIVHAVLQDHKAHIDCRSTVGKGTSFYLYFPISRDAAEIFPTEEIRGGTECILVVDDDPVQREVTRSLLEKLRYTVTLAESGERAIELLTTQPVDLVLLDMIMPGGMDGAQTYREVLNIRPDQPAIIVSGYAEGDRVTQALKAGAGRFLKKPLTLKSLAQAVRKELDRQPAICPPETAHAAAMAAGPL